MFLSWNLYTYNEYYSVHVSVHEIYVRIMITILYMFLSWNLYMYNEYYSVATDKLIVHTVYHFTVWIFKLLSLFLSLNPKYFRMYLQRTLYNSYNTMISSLIPSLYTRHVVWIVEYNNIYETIYYWKLYNNWSIYIDFYINVLCWFNLFLWNMDLK